MRDVNRIDPLMTRLAECWKEVPNWRLGQFMINALSETLSKTDRDPFYIEDDELIEKIEQLFKEKKND